jgi:hypothetical protein
MPAPITGEAALVLLGGGGNTELWPVDCGDFWKGGCGDRDWDAFELVESVGEEVRCTGFRPTGGADFFEVVLVEEIEARRSLGEVKSGGGRLDVDTEPSWREAWEKLLGRDAVEDGLYGGGSLREPLVAGRGFGGGGNDGVLWDGVR